MGVFMVHPAPASIQAGSSRELSPSLPVSLSVYESLRSALSNTIHRQGWKVEQISFIAGASSVNEQDLRKNLKFCKVPRLASIPSAWNWPWEYSNEYTKILKCMYSTRLNSKGVYPGQGLTFSRNPIDPKCCHPLPRSYPRNLPPG